MQEKEKTQLLLQWLQEEIEAGQSDALLVEDLTPPKVDLATLLAEMTALKTEVRTETKTARALRDKLEESFELLQQELAQSKQREKKLQEALEASKRENTRQNAKALIDLADRLESTIENAKKLVEPRRHWFTMKVDPAAQAMLEGLRLTESKLQGHLKNAGIQKVQSKEQPFDANTMECIDTAKNPEVPDGYVVEEITAGYQDEQGSIRTAQVIVNKNPRSSKTLRKVKKLKKIEKQDS